MLHVTSSRGGSDDVRDRSPFPGGTREQYDAVLDKVHPAGALPAGQIYHAAGPSDDGWTIVAVHESRESWETFRDGTLLPTLGAGVEDGLAGPPRETAFEIVTETTVEPA